MHISTIKNYAKLVNNNNSIGCSRNITENRGAYCTTAREQYTGFAGSDLSAIEYSIDRSHSLTVLSAFDRASLQSSMYKRPSQACVGLI